MSQNFPLSCQLCSPAVPIDNSSDCATHRLVFHRTLGAQAFFSSLGPPIALTAAPPPPKPLAPPPVSVSTALGVFPKAITSLSPFALPSTGGISVDLINSLLDAYGTSINCPFTLNRTVLFAYFLNFACQHKGVFRPSDSTFLGKMLIYNDDLTQHFEVDFRGFLTALLGAPALASMGFSFRSLLAVLEPALWEIWQSDNLLLSVLKRDGTAHSRQVGLLGATGLASVPAWVPVPGLFNTQLMENPLFVRARAFLSSKRSPTSRTGATSTASSQRLITASGQAPGTMVVRRGRGTARGRRATP